MSDIASFCRALALDEAAVWRALKSEQDPTARAMPWYVQLILGIGAWITALAMIAFALAFLSLVLAVEEPGLPAALLGMAMAGLGFGLLSRRPAGAFAHQLAVALAAAGSMLAAGGIGFETESLWSAAIIAFVFCLLAVWRARDDILQFLLAALAAGLSAAALIDADAAHRVDIVALAAPLGLWLYLRPPQIEVRPAASVLLLATPLLAALDGSPLLAPSGAGWVARAIHISLFLALLRPFWRRTAESADRLAIGIFAAAAGAVCLLLPAGGSAALLLMMLAFTLGSRPFAVIGAALQAYFVWRFYHDLEASLLDKSLILMSVGVLLLAAYALIARRLQGAAA